MFLIKLFILVITTVITRSESSDITDVSVGNTTNYDTVNGTNETNETTGPSYPDYPNYTFNNDDYMGFAPLMLLGIMVIGLIGFLIYANIYEKCCKNDEHVELEEIEA